jgi:hypothetical protein
VDEFGPALLKMTADEIKAFVLLAFKGDVMGAFSVVLSKMDNPELIAAGEALHVDWQTGNIENKRWLELQRKAGEVAVTILLSIRLAAVGL